MQVGPERPIADASSRGVEPVVHHSSIMAVALQLVGQRPVHMQPTGEATNNDVELLMALRSWEAVMGK